MRALQDGQHPGKAVLGQAAIQEPAHGPLEGLQLSGTEPLRTAAGVVSSLVPRAITRRLRFSIDLGDIMLVCARKG